MQLSRLHPLPELGELENFLESRCLGRVEVIANIERSQTLSSEIKGPSEFPIHKITYGTQEGNVPTLFVVGGVHGLERIGTQVVLALLNTFNQFFSWDQGFRERINSMRVVFIPLINPWGMFLQRRSNGNGVDLMRNAPVEASGPLKTLISGHRISPKLPWYRGSLGEAMEPEAQVLLQAIQKDLERSSLAVSLDIHSGFGLRDQIWFPYAKSLEVFPHLTEMMALKKTFDQAYPHHIYKIEPQSLNYVTHGDLWDYLYDGHRSRSKNVYLPLCLELGSWSWVRKNPFQFFRKGGLFDPVRPHRRARALRRHQNFMDFLLRILSNPNLWTQQPVEDRQRLHKEALEIWYPQKK